MRRARWAARAGAVAAISVLAATGLAVATAPPAAAGPCPGGTTATTVDFSTGSAGGVQLPLGVNDPDWVLTPPGGVVAPNKTMAYGTWVASGSKARWIGPTNGDTTSAAAGYYTYTYRFVVPLGSKLKPFTFKYAVDNGVEFKLNGSSLGGFPSSITSNDWTAYTSLHDLSSGTTPPYVTGPNELTATVYNGGGPTGLLVIGTGLLCTSSAECQADGVLVRVDGGDAVTLGHAAATAPGTDEDWVSGGSGSLSGVDYDYRGVYGKCSIGAGSASVYGEAGAADVLVKVATPPVLVRARALRNWAGLPSGTVGCSAEEVYVNGPLSAAPCPQGEVSDEDADDYVVLVSNLLDDYVDDSAGDPEVTVTLNEHSSTTQGGVTRIRRAAIHVHVKVGIHTVDVYVGYVDIVHS